MLAEFLFKECGFSGVVMPWSCSGFDTLFLFSIVIILYLIVKIFDLIENNKNLLKKLEGLK